MLTCPVCGGTVSAEDRQCPFCSQTILRVGEQAGPEDWNLPTDDGSSWGAPADNNLDAETATMHEDWMVMADDGSPPPPGWPPVPVQPIPVQVVPPQPANPGNVSLPPWAPVPAQEQPCPPTEEFDFTFDLDRPAPEQQPAQPAGGSFEFAPWSQPEPPAPAPVPVPVPTPLPPAPPPPAPAAAPPPRPKTPSPTPPRQPTPPPAAPAAPAWVCPACGKTYGKDYDDTFCVCGTELVAAAPSPAPVPAPAPAPPSPARPPAPPSSGTERPAVGTRCLVLYGPDKRPLHYFPLTGDALLIGRLDPVSNCFPDIDVSEFVDEATARRVSRKHALVLHARASDSYLLRPLPGNTGTQVEKELVAGGQDVPLTPGTRLVLGGAVRLKFEVM